MSTDVDEATRAVAARLREDFDPLLDEITTMFVDRIPEFHHDDEVCG